MSVHYLHDGGASRWSGILFRSGQRFSICLESPYYVSFFKRDGTGGSESTTSRSAWDSRRCFSNALQSFFFFCWCSFIVLRCFLFFSAEYPCLILGFGVKMGLLRFCFVDFVSSWFMPTEREAGRGGEGNKVGWECVFSGVQTHDAWMGSMLI